MKDPAIHAGSEKLLHQLIEKGADVNVMVEGGPAPLHVAVERDCEAAVKALLVVCRSQPAILYQSSTCKWEQTYGHPPEPCVCAAGRS